MKIFPAVHYTMGGLWAGFTKDEKTGGLKMGAPNNMMTNIPGLYAMGEVSFAFHGANRLGANSLLSCIFEGLFGGPCIRNYITDVAKVAAADVPASVFDDAVKRETDKQNVLLNNTSGNENPYLLWQEMGKSMTDNCTVVRHNERLEKTLADCESWKERYRRVRLSDTGMWTNQNLSFTRALWDMIVLAEAILKGALLRNESRGAHYKPQYPERDDANFLKTTLARYDAGAGAAKIEYGPVDTSLVPPRARTYGKKAEPAVVKNAAAVARADAPTAVVAQ
jgi:succinate dehydrogenase / fumarate reductase flavoprotein subunit